MTQGILQRIANGDKTAVQDCLNAYSGLIWSLARRMSPNTDDAEDAVQEIFIDIWKNAERFDSSQSSETTFIAMIARRRLIDRLRYSNRRISADSIEDIVVELANTSNVELQNCVEAKEAAKALEILRPEQRQVLQLSIIQGLSHQEISDATGMPLGTVKTHARRGLLQVREFLGLGNTQQGKEVTV
ncbi:MAG TPA: sigma-70 family RNA polymerase sigma factor [Pyrinomonadaceae bacterium]